MKKKKSHKDKDRRRDETPARQEKRDRTRSPRRPAREVPGLHRAHFDESLPGRGHGVFGIGMPRLRSQEIVEAMTDAMLRANQAREKRLAREKSERKERRHRKKDKKKKKRDDSSSSDTSSSSSGSALIRKMQGHDDQPFRQAAKHHPGVIFADAVAKSRQGVHQVNHELQVSRDGPVFRSWLDTCFRPRCGSRIGSHKDELEVLIIGLMR